MIENNNIIKTIIATLLGLASSLLFSQDCIDFEDFNFGTSFGNGQENTSFEATFSTQPVVLPGGGAPSESNASIGSSGTALNSGQALRLANSTVEVCLPCVELVSFRFTNQGGFFNFSIDGSPLVVPYNKAGSLTVNGVDIEITGTLINNRLTGEITLTPQSGNFECFSVGGQELLIDDICFVPCENPQSPSSAVPGITCVEFEALDKQGPYSVGSGYLEDGILFKIKEHNNQFSGATSSTQRLAGHLGLEFYFKEAGFSVESECWSSIKFNFYTKDPVTMVVNGLSTSAANLTALDGYVFGNVLLTIMDDPDQSGGGIACLTGRIETFELTGEDFHLDHFCAADCLRDCIDFEGEASNAKYVKADIISEDGFDLEILDPLNSGEPAQISTSNLAAGGGQELRLQDGELSFGNYCFQGLAFQYGQFDNGIRLTIDNDDIEVNYMSELDGLTVSGMTIEVFVVQKTGNSERGVVRMKGAAGKIFLLASGIAIDRVCIDECPEPLVVGFDEEPLDEVYEEGETFGEDDVEFEVCPLRTSDNGTATITADNQTGSTGQALALSFATVKFDLLCASQLSFKFANFGANGGPQGFGTDVRLNVNGSSSGLVDNFTDLDGDTIGGVNVNVSASGNSGTVILTGNIESIIMGGFNIQLDDIMQTPFQGGPQCHNFNTWDPNLTYGIFDTNPVNLTDGTIALFNFFENLDNELVDGTASIGTAQNAGGSGRELTLDDSVISFIPLLGGWTDVSFRFYEAGSSATREVSLEINGDIQIFSRISDLDGQVFRFGTSEEVTVSVVSQDRNGRLVGIVKLEGITESLSIGGEALTIDDICGTQQAAPVYLDGWVVSCEESAPDEFTFVWDIEALNVQNSDFIVRRGNNLTSFGPFNGISATITSHGAGTNLYRVTTTQPVEAVRQFYRVELKPF